MSLTREQILAQDGFPTEEVAVPEWGAGATVKVRGLSTKDRFAWALASRKATAGDKKAPNPVAMLLTLGVVDDSGKPLFQLQDVDVLADKRGDVVDRIAEAVMNLSGLSDKAAEDAEGNSEATPSGDSPSASPATSDAPSPN